jgi:hypothetical protein
LVWALAQERNPTNSSAVGQLAANRVYVQRRVYSAFVERFGEAVAQLKTGHGLDPETEIGPMTRVSVARKCRAQIEDAIARGARLAAGGIAPLARENFVRPTLLAEVSDAMLIAREETFGPVAAVLPFDNEEEVIARANATEMGLAAYLYCDDLRRALRVSEALDYGMVGVNTTSFTGPPIPFGGWKQSGLGREGSRHGLAEFMELKYVCFGDLSAGRSILDTRGRRHPPDARCSTALRRLARPQRPLRFRPNNVVFARTAEILGMGEVAPLPLEGADTIIFGHVSSHGTGRQEPPRMSCVGNRIRCAGRLLCPASRSSRS